jgi:hypothetical protein
VTKNSTAKNMAATAKTYSFCSLFFFILKFILFYVKYSNVNSTINSKQKQQEAISAVDNKH